VTWLLVLLGAWGAWGQSPALRSAEALLNEADIEWRSVDAPPGAFHLERGSTADRQVEALQSDARSATADVLALLGESEAPPVDLFYVGSIETMEGLVGARPKALSVPEALYALFVVTERVRARHRHEMAHVLAGHFWGPAARPAHWINEGVAQYADGTCAGYEVDVLAAALIREGRGIPPADLIFAFGVQPPLEANVLVGSFVGHLLEEHGVSAVEVLWRHGLERFPLIFGMELEDAVSVWRKGLDAVPVGGVDLQRLEPGGCG
jgi:hypothetical protein